MTLRQAAVTSLLTIAVLAACDAHITGTGRASSSDTVVRFVNATDTPINVVANGSVSPVNANLGFGEVSSCIGVSSTSPSLAVRDSGSATNLATFTPSFTAGGSYFVVAYPGVGGVTQFTTLASNGFVPAAGQSGVRVFNATASAFDAFITAPGATLAAATVSAVSFGAGSSFVSTSAGTSQLRFTTTGTQTILLDAGTQSFTAGQTALVVVAPPATGTTTLRSFTAPSC